MMSLILDRLKMFPMGLVEKEHLQYCLVCSLIIPEKLGNRGSTKHIACDRHDETSEI